MGDGQLYVRAPEFMQLEICNSLIRRHKATAEQALKAIQELVHNQITFYPIGDMVQEVAYSTQEYELSSYDVLYLALAQHLQIPLVTNDSKLLGVKVHCITPAQAMTQLA